MPMPLPVHFLDEDKNVVENVGLKTKDSGYRADPTYHPTYKAIRCKECKMLGVACFPNGFNLKDGDRLMAGRPIRGLCLHCGKQTELIPLEPSLKHLEPGIIHAYRIQESLEDMANKGERLDPTGMIWPMARRQEHDRRREAERQRQLREGQGGP